MQENNKSETVFIDHKNKKAFLSWWSVDLAVAKLAMGIATKYKPKHDHVILFPIIRGGLAIAAILSHKLEEVFGLKNTVIPIRPGENGLIELENLDSTGYSNDPYILVDDILDTGETLKNFLDNRNDLDVAIVLSKKTDQIDYLSGMDYQETIHPTNFGYWIVFPWEKSIEQDRVIRTTVT